MAMTLRLTDDDEKILAELAREEGVSRQEATVRAIREAAFGGNAWPEIALCLGLGVVYVALGAIALRNFERLARSRATLSLT